ncbi:hypothetical protein FISHEDRAFT_59016 [Fistulina hepatica ATCC 64428]|uniref:Uncharacterized protein n=1 Tax=Fistulina hepatica ATCC 64428 TaxID=1128425 RepID=A0A0D7ABX8_9AGAR|nr:hypothetical protein FISHEDRAFT_59016 [Fistulina hepatica ATCC 64428]
MTPMPCERELDGATPLLSLPAQASRSATLVRCGRTEKARHKVELDKLASQPPNLESTVLRIVSDGPGQIIGSCKDDLEPSRSVSTPDIDVELGGQEMSCGYFHVHHHLWPGPLILESRREVDEDREDVEALTKRKVCRKERVAPMLRGVVTNVKYPIFKLCDKRCGVRTSAGGILTAVVVIFALYGCTPIFYWILSTALSVVIHAVANLVTPPHRLSTYMRSSARRQLRPSSGSPASLSQSSARSRMSFTVYAKIWAPAALLFVRVAMLHGDYLGHVRVEGAGDPSDAKITSSDTRDLYVAFLLPPNTSRSVTVFASTSVKPAAPGEIIHRIEEGTIHSNIALLDTRFEPEPAG